MKDGNDITELSHEYGHHFTFFHLKTPFLPGIQESTYYNLRQLYKYPSKPEEDTKSKYIAGVF